MIRERSATDVADAVIGRHRHTVDVCPSCSECKLLDHAVDIGKGIFILVCRACRGWRP